MKYPMCLHAYVSAALNSVSGFSYFLFQNMENLVTRTRSNSKNIHQNHAKLCEIIIWMYIRQQERQSHHVVYSTHF